jgi:hypothetical protein
MFKYKLSEAKTSTIVIDDIDALVIEAMLQ